MAVATLVQEAGPRAKLMSAVPNGLADLAEFYGAGKTGFRYMCGCVLYDIAEKGPGRFGTRDCGWTV